VTTRGAQANVGPNFIFVSESRALSLLKRFHSLSEPMRAFEWVQPLATERHARPGMTVPSMRFDVGQTVRGERDDRAGTA
jgi:hypothetical protein